MAGIIKRTKKKKTKFMTSWAIGPKEKLNTTLMMNTHSYKLPPRFVSFYPLVNTSPNSHQRGFSYS